MIRFERVFKEKDSLPCDKIDSHLVPHIGGGFETFDLVHMCFQSINLTTKVVRNQGSKRKRWENKRFWRGKEDVWRRKRWERVPHQLNRREPLHWWSFLYHYGALVCDDPSCKHEIFERQDLTQFETDYNIKKDFQKPKEPFVSSFATVMIPYYQYPSEYTKEGSGLGSDAKGKETKNSARQEFGRARVLHWMSRITKKNRKLAHLYKHHDFLACPPSGYCYS